MVKILQIVILFELKMEIIMMHGSYYYNRIYCWTHFENYNFLLLVPVKFAYATLAKGVLQLKLIIKTRLFE